MEQVYFACALDVRALDVRVLDVGVAGISSI